MSSLSAIGKIRQTPCPKDTPGSLLLASHRLRLVVVLLLCICVVDIPPPDPHFDGILWVPRSRPLVRLWLSPAPTLGRHHVIERNDRGRVEQHLAQRECATFAHAGAGACKGHGQSTEQNPPFIAAGRRNLPYGLNVPSSTVCTLRPTSSFLCFRNLSWCHSLGLGKKLASNWCSS